MRKGWRFWKRAVRAAVIRHRERSEAIQRCAFWITSLRSR
jgi:hypothetical protein